MDKLQYLMDIKSSITQAAAKTMEHLSEFVFVSMGNLTLARRDAYLTHLKNGIKPDTVAALRTAPYISLYSFLMPWSRELRRKSHIMNQKDILLYLVARHAFTLMRGQTGGRINGRTRKQTNQRGRILGRVGTENLEAKFPITHCDQPRSSSRINDNYCVIKLQAWLLAGSSTPRQTIDTDLNVHFHVEKVAHSASRHSQKRDLSPGSAVCYYKECKLKYVKSVYCVTQLSCVKPVTNVKMLPQISL